MALTYNEKTIHIITKNYVKERWTDDLSDDSEQIVNLNEKKVSVRRMSIVT